MLRSSILIAAAAAAGLATSAQANIPNYNTGKSVSVSYADLDLSTEAGRATLNTRLDRAIKRVCELPSTNTIEERRAERNCMIEARASFAEQHRLAIGQDQSQLANAEAGASVAAIR